MAEGALALGPWALLNHAEHMRTLIRDVASAFAATPDKKPSACLFGTYHARPPKKAQCRPLPFPDALLAGNHAIDETDDAALLHESENAVAAEELQLLAESPWLWKLQWTVLTILLASTSMRTELLQHCPQPVAEFWGAAFEERMLNKIMGTSSADNGLPGYSNAACTPMMTVISELQLLRLSYERK